MDLGCLSQAAISEKQSSSTQETSEQTPPHSCLSLLGALPHPPANPAMLSWLWRAG